MFFLLNILVFMKTKFIFALGARLNFPISKTQRIVPMTELNYFFERSNGEMMNYQLIQFTVNAPWSVLDGDEFLGSIEKNDGKWIAVLGNNLTHTIVQGAGNLIDKQHYHALPAEICARWPKLVAEVIAKSDDMYMVVCKPEINFQTFKRIFTKFIPGLLKDEWPVDFYVYNDSFNEDFVLMAHKREEERFQGSVSRW